MPTTLLITDENDVLRDEGEAHAHKLMKAGVDVTAMRYLGTHHRLLNAKPFDTYTRCCKNALTLVKTKLHKWLMRIRRL